MNSTSNSDSPSENSNKYAYYYVGSSLGFLLLMMFIAFTSYWCSRRNLRNMQSRASAVVMERDTTLTIQVHEEEQDTILNSYPMLLYSQVKLHKPDITSLSCSICLADYMDSEWLRLLPDCGHFFHKECIDTWFGLNLSCPVCRNSPLPTPLQTPLAEVTPLTTRHD